MKGSKNIKLQTRETTRTGELPTEKVWGRTEEHRSAEELTEDTRRGGGESGRTEEERGEQRRRMGRGEIEKRGRTDAWGERRDGTTQLMTLTHPLCVSPLWTC